MNSKYEASLGRYHECVFFVCLFNAKDKKRTSKRTQFLHVSNNLHKLTGFTNESLGIIKFPILHKRQPKVIDLFSDVT